MNIRNKRVVKKIDLKNGVGLELGPLTAPVVTKADGNIYYLDHMSTADLKKKYKNEPVDPDKIVSVDFVLKDNLKKAVKNKKFDYVIASHVIEHIPDTVSWLEEVSSILKPGGVISLVIPDKRFTFDLQRRITEPSDIIGAYLDKLKKPTSAMMYDFASLYAEEIDTASVWNDKDYYLKLPPKHRWSNFEAIEMSIESKKPRKYVDSHCHVFTPVSFINIIHELTENELIDFEVCSFLETQSYELEFFVSLKKVDKKVTKKARLKKIPQLNDDEHARLVGQDLAKNNTILNDELNRLRASASWRITAPLRKTMSLFKHRDQ